MKKLLLGAMMVASAIATNAQTYYTYFLVTDADSGYVLENYPIKFTYTNGALFGQYDLRNTLDANSGTPGWVTFFGPSTTQCGKASVVAPYATIVSGNISPCMTGGNNYLSVRNTKGTNFLVNNSSVSANSGSPTLICRTNSGPLVFNNASSWSGMIASSTLNIYNSVGTLISTNTYGSGGAPASIDLTQSGFIGASSGVYRLTLTNTFTRGGAVIAYTGYINVTNVTASVDFEFNAPAGGTVPSTGTPVLGATSGGVNKPAGTITGTTVSDYSIEILKGSTSLGKVSSSAPLTGSYNFNTITSGYFFTNFSTIATTNPTFTATFSVTTPCGIYAKSCNFKIDGTNQWLRPGSEEGQTEGNENVLFSPNPANRQVAVKWFEKDENIRSAQLLVTDVVGKEVIRQVWTAQKGNNEQMVNIANLTSGIYYYKLVRGAVVSRGSFVKQ